MILVAAVFLILSLSWFLGRCFQFLGQPRVIGEIIAGLVLGPSLLGLWSPEWQHRLFSPEHMSLLTWPAHLGLGVFLFSVGLDSRHEDWRRQPGRLFKVWMGSLFVPLAIGAWVGWFWLYPLEGGLEASRLRFSAFIAVAMAVTAFPVLVRMLEDRGWHRRPLGRLAIGVASMDDLCTWVFLAFIVHEGAGAALHGLFIAFALGWALSGTRLKSWKGRAWMHRIAAWMMPFFFVLSGLRTDLNLLRNVEGLGVLIGILLIAVFVKIAGTWFGARWAGLKPRPALVLGVLMNTRGLVELVVLNLGLRAGLLSPRLFAAFVVMALVTTLMTGPLLLAMHAPREMDQ
ncbi:MAG: cation:proton antiporter [Bdellovibrionaceae bacterium]|nr:cation:proton antiporter [Pseudobdellovibrionaceae bacterium]